MSSPPALLPGNPAPDTAGSPPLTVVSNTQVPKPITMPQACACGCGRETSRAVMAAVSVSDEGNLVEGLGLLAKETCATRLMQARHMAGLKTAIIHPEVAKDATTATSATFTVMRSRRHVHQTEHHLYQVD